MDNGFKSHCEIDGDGIFTGSFRIRERKYGCVLWSCIRILMIADWTASDEIFEDLNVYMFSNRTLYKEEVARRLEKYVDDNCLRCYPISAPDPIKRFSRLRRIGRLIHCKKMGGIHL